MLRRLATVVPAPLVAVLVGFAEGLGAAKTYAADNGYQNVPDKELTGLGAANLAAGLGAEMRVQARLTAEVASRRHDHVGGDGGDAGGA
ncbi:MAG TPA: SulP family inorganic anion transporter [Streptosporangiaceae bacterium]|nr:SulP family inorganic anion transporter [Streptosporangiaceae bacterium]